MTQNTIPTTNAAGANSPAWDENLARWISLLTTPTLLILIGFGLIAKSIGTPNAWYWAGLYSVITVLLPTIYIIRKVKLGEITDFHIQVREQRKRPLLMILVLSIVGWLVMYLGSAPLPLLIFAGVGIFQIAFLFAITLRWKISGHSTVASGFALFFYAVYGGYAALFLLLIPIVAWARIRRNRHELTQTIAGSIAGIAYILTVLFLLHRSGFLVR